MAGDVVNIKVRSPLKQRSGLTGKYYAIPYWPYCQTLGCKQKIHLDRDVKK